MTKEDFRALKKLIQRNAFQGRTWDVARLSVRGKGRQSALPFVVTLGELMKAEV